MCYAVGSLQQATSTCPMCKVFKPSSSRCPHIKETCRNSTAHPRHDVVYLKNAEVHTFNGCGYCKWAKTSPPMNRAGYLNPGWPGCCRPPTASDNKYVGAADWPAVSLVHHVPIPPEIKSILDGICTSPASPRGTPPLSSPPGSVRVANVQAAAPGIARRSSYNVATPGRTETATTRSNPVAVPTKRGSGGSPQQVTASLSSPPRGTIGDGTPSSPPNVYVMDLIQGSRRSAMDVFADKRPDPSNTTQNSPGRKHVELGGSVSRRSSERRLSISSMSAGISKPAASDATPPRRRMATTTIVNTPPQAARTKERSVERVGDNTIPRRGGSTVEEVSENVEKMSLASSASSSSSGSSSETTIISDGAFTDYLSDDSEEELQKQAEKRAAILAQNQLEDLEFKAARQQLTHVDLRPPKSWTVEVQSTPRSQIQQNRAATSYGPASFAPAYAASTASRG